MRPLGDFVLVSIQKPKPTSKFLTVTEQKQDIQFGKVIEVGPKVKEIKAGEVVCWARGYASEYKIDGKQTALIKEMDIVGYYND